MILSPEHDSVQLDLFCSSDVPLGVIKGRLLSTDILSSFLPRRLSGSCMKVRPTGCHRPVDPPSRAESLSETRSKESCGWSDKAVHPPNRVVAEVLQRCTLQTEQWVES